MRHSKFIIIFITRAYVNRRGPRMKGVNMDVILSSLSLMAASLLALVRGIAISIIIMQAVIAAVLSEDYCSWHRASRSLLETNLCEPRGLLLRR